MIKKEREKVNVTAETIPLDFNKEIQQQGTKVAYTSKQLSEDRLL